MNLDAVYLGDADNKALFYPCCGQDLDVPIRLFASALSDFFFVDIRKPRRPRLEEVAVWNRSDSTFGVDAFIHRTSGHPFRLHRWECRAEEVISQLPELGVFFYRGDTRAQGEGSSGVMWLGGELFSRILGLLVPGGLVVTDGSNMGPGGPRRLSDYYRNWEVGGVAACQAAPFEYEERKFECIGYAGERYGPTLIWRVR